MFELFLLAWPPFATVSTGTPSSYAELPKVAKTTMEARMLGEVRYIMITTTSSRVGAHLVKKSTREIMCASKCTGAVNLTK